MCNYEGCSKSSDLYLVALSIYIFESHTMHHCKELAFTFIMVHIFSLDTLSFNYYSTLYMAHSMTTGLFSCYRIIMIFESESFKPGIFKTTNKNCIVFLLFVTYNVHSNGDRLCQFNILSTMSNSYDVNEIDN